MQSDLVAYQDRETIYHPDTCLPLVEAHRLGKLQLEAWGRYSYPGLRLGPDELHGINSIGYWDTHQQQEWGLDWHRNEGIEITYVETGTNGFSIDGQEHMLVPGQLFITRPWQLHRIGNPTVAVGKVHWIILDVDVRQPHQEWNWPLWIILNQTDLDELTKLLRQNEQPIWNADADIRRCFQRIGQLLKDENLTSGESWIKLYINEILIHLLSLLRKGNITLNENLTSGRRTVELFITYLAELLVEPWTLESMATHCQLGQTRFVHYMKLITNMTPMQYLTFLRMQKAAKMLVDNIDLSVTSVGYECGFSSIEYFVTVFRKQYDCSPSSYRAMQIEHSS